MKKIRESNLEASWRNFFSQKSTTIDFSGTNSTWYLAQYCSVTDDGVHKKPEMSGPFNPSVDEVPGSDGVKIIDIRFKTVQNFCSFP